MVSHPAALAAVTPARPTVPKPQNPMLWPAAFVIPKPDEELTRAELDEAVRAEVAGYKAPRYIEWVEEIPRNISGKILKNVLTERPTDQSQRVSRNGA